MGACSKAGVLVKGSNYLESLASLESLLFDKTGTLTEGVFEVTALHPNDITDEQLLHLASHVERFQLTQLPNRFAKLMKKKQMLVPLQT